MAEEKSKAQQENPMANMCQGPTGFLYALAFVFLIMIMFNRELGDQISEYVGIVLYPLIGFGSRWPLLTMFGAGLLTITISTTIRHFTMDWIDMAKKQRVMTAFNKELKEAQKAGNQSKVERMQEQNADIMAMQSQSMMSQMKASIFSMVIAILIFRWMYRFIDSVPQPTATTPWNVAWPLTGGAFGEVCGSLCMAGANSNGLPYWILLYMVITIPIGQALMRGLKFFEYSRKLKAKGEEVFISEEKLRDDLDEKARKKKEDRKKLLEEARGSKKSEPQKKKEKAPEKGRKGKSGKKKKSRKN